MPAAVPGAGVFTFAGPALDASEASPRWHAARGAACAAAAGLAAASEPWNAGDAPGLLVLQTSVTTAVAAAGLAGLTGGVAAVEDARDEGRLALLRMAEARGWRLAWNLAAPPLLQAAGVAAVLVPLSLLTVTLGGVSADQAVFGAALPMAAAVPATAAGLAAAAWSRSPLCWAAAAGAAAFGPELLAGAGLMPTDWAPWRPLAAIRWAASAGGPTAASGSVWAAATVLMTGAAGAGLLRSQPAERPKRTRRRRPPIADCPHRWAVRQFDEGGRAGRRLYAAALAAVTLLGILSWRPNAAGMAMLGVAWMASVRLALVSARRVRREADGGESLRLTPGGTARGSSLAIAAGRSAWLAFGVCYAGSTLFLAYLTVNQGVPNEMGVLFGLTVAMLVTVAAAGRLAAIIASRRSVAAAVGGAAVAVAACEMAGFAVGGVTHQHWPGDTGLVRDVCCGLLIGLPGAALLAGCRWFEPDELHLRHAVRGPRRRDAERGP